MGKNNTRVLLTMLTSFFPCTTQKHSGDSVHSNYCGKSPAPAIIMIMKETKAKKGTIECDGGTGDCGRML